MSLFEVPGWSVSGAPVRDSPRSLSKKRKRPSAPERLESAAVNLEKLTIPVSSSRKPSKRQKTQPVVTRMEGVQKKKKSKSKSGSSPQVSSEIAGKHLPVSNPDAKTIISSKPAPKNPSEAVVNLRPNETLTTLQKGMKNSLDAARFRLINESLYKSDSQEACRMVKANPNIFEEYHTGFRHQVRLWPTNPVDHYISKLASYPQRTIVADLGCGDATLARSLLPKGISVLSFDLVSDHAFVVEADICSTIPLPGSEGSQAAGKSTGEGQIVDVVVCALSLMSTNWILCVREAWRILKSDGQFLIAEVTSRFSDIEQFEKLVSSVGFRLKSKNDSNTHFMMFEFAKVSRSAKTEQDWARLLSESGVLKPSNLHGPMYLVILVQTRAFWFSKLFTPHHPTPIPPSIHLRMSKVNKLVHPLVDAELSKLRQKSATSKEFREGIDTISFILGYEASRSLEVDTFNGETPVASFVGTKIKPRIGLTPILRAGLGMTDALLKLFPAAPVYHLGLYREKVSLQPVEYYSKLPPNPPIDTIFLLDPLIATGGTAAAAIAMLHEWGIQLKDIKLLCVLASETGLEYIKSKHPDLEIWVAGVDPELTVDGIINPGLGDTGDRLFNTIKP